MFDLKPKLSAFVFNIFNWEVSPAKLMASPTPCHPGAILSDTLISK